MIRIDDLQKVFELRLTSLIRFKLFLQTVKVLTHKFDTLIDFENNLLEFWGCVLLDFTYFDRNFIKFIIQISGIVSAILEVFFKHSRKILVVSIYCNINLIQFWVIGLDFGHNLNKLTGYFWILRFYCFSKCVYLCSVNAYSGWDYFKFIDICLLV